MLMLALVENLRRLADELLLSRRARTMADDYLQSAETDHAMAWPADIQLAAIVQLLLRTREYGRKVPILQQTVQAHLEANQLTAEEAVRSEHQRQGVAQVSVANAITSLRLCSAIDWREFVERVSLVEQTLRRDPAGVYSRMDFLSRDQQRHAVEQIAAPSGEAQLQLALKAVESAREAAADPSAADREAHVGYHLVGPGRLDLEADVAFRPPIRLRLRRLVFGHPTLLYLGSIGVLTGIMLAAASRWLPGPDGHTPMVVVILVCLAMPALDLAMATVQRVMAWAVSPRRLPRLDFSEGVPDDARTMVVVPTLLASPEAVAALMEHLEVLAYGNLDPRIHFAILSDFVDAPSATLEDDGPILSAARDGILDLNLKLGEGHADRFFLFHRERRWTDREGAWMGWERKRGKIDEFNGLLRGATDTTFTTQIGDLDVLPGVQYCLTLDTDTRLPRDAA
jgi:cyclic beta-1,2-glucan synthetase